MRVLYARVLLLVIAAAAAAGCGYHVVGLGEGAPRAVWVGPVVDASNQPLFGSQLRSALAREIVDLPGVSLAPKKEARALLTARVGSLNESVVAFVAGDRPREYLLAAEVDATLAAPDGRVLWKGLKIKANRQFTAGSSVEGTESNKEAALELLSRDLSREILRRVGLAVATGSGSP